MPDQREYQEPAEQPWHPPTQAARPAPWRPTPYSQAEHLRQLGPRQPEQYPQQYQPSFSPQPQAPRQPQQSPPPQPSFSFQPQAPRRPQPDLYAQARYAQPTYMPQPWQPPAPRRKRRIFLWVFLAVQAVFIIWIVGGLASHPAGPTAAQQAAQECANGGWQVLFKSQADCQVHYAHALNEAGNVGKGLGVAAIVIFWMVADFFLGLGYGIYRLASRR